MPLPIFVHLCALCEKLKYQCLNSGAQQSTSHPVTFMCDLARLFWTDGSFAGYSVKFHFVFEDIVIFRKIWHRLSLRTGTSSQLSLVSTDFLTGWNIVLFFHLWQHLLFLIMYQNSFMCDLYVLVALVYHRVVSFALLYQYSCFQW
jgi:hypothetical protein